MSAASANVLQCGRERARTGSWRGDRDVAFLAPLADSPPPSVEFLHRCLDTLAQRGYRRVVTGALSPMEQVGFLAAGFDIHEHLHLLGIDLGPDLPSVPDGLPLHRGRRRTADVLAVDASAFSAFWRFDEEGLRDAIRATPSTRYRVAVAPGGTVAGYAVCGRSGPRGFVQRLAVDPGVQRRGTGRRLLLDGLHWMRRHAVRRALVNTQIGNEGALSLYRAVGFVDEPGGLSVLTAGLP